MRITKNIIRWFCLFFLFAYSVSSPSLSVADMTFSDTNFTNSVKNKQGEYRPYNFNRFRTDVDMRSDSDLFRVKGILDFEAYIGRTFLNTPTYPLIEMADPPLPFNPYFGNFDANDVAGRLYLYRLFGEVRTDHNHFTFGLQRIPLGVGRLWNPSDTFNPILATDIESEERLGVFAGRFTHYLNDFSFIEILTNFQERMELDKYGVRYKGHHLGIDAGITYIDDADFNMIGLEIESNLLSTGIEVRTEWGIFSDDAIDKTYASGVVGLEYGFPNNISVLAEYFYNGLGAGDKNNYDPTLLVNGNWNLGRHYLGTTVTYEINPITFVGITSIFNLTDGSIFNGPSISYSINDETTLSFGTNIFTGTNSSEFSNNVDNLYYIRLETFF